MGSATHLMRNVRSGGMRIFNCEQNKNTAPVVSKCQPQKCAYVRRNKRHNNPSRKSTDDMY